MQAAIASSAVVSDPVVERHFDRAADLYVDHALACYRQSVAQRLELLSAATGLTADDAPTLLDIGCGGGAFLDLYLERFPRGSATGIDISTQMLSRNLPNARKKLLQGDALALPATLGEYDIIAIDAVMHHLVARRSYTQTRARMRGFLNSLSRYLRPSGVLVIREIYHEFRMIPALGSRLVYEMTTHSVPGFVARRMRAAGVQTANVGVCFQTRAQWLELFTETGFSIARSEDRVWPGQPYRRFGFAQSGDMHYVLTRTRPQL